MRVSMAVAQTGVMLVLMTCLRLHVDETLSSGVDGSATGEPMRERRSGPRPNPLPRRGVLDLATCDAGAVAGSGIKTRC